MRRLHRLISILVALALGAAISGTSSAQSARPAAAVLWLSSKSQFLSRQTDVPLATSAAAGVPVLVDDSQVFQRMEGFGGAMTDSAAWVLTYDLDDSGRRAVMRRLFSRDSDGIGLSYVRVAMGGSEFTNSAFYSYDDTCDEAGNCVDDPDLNLFSIAHDVAYILPRLRDARQLNPDLKIMASPWTAPAWMKTSRSTYGGSLRMEPEVLGAYANYFVRFIQAYADEGVPIDAITVQNEPDPDSQNTDDPPSMVMRREDEALFVRDYLAPVFAAHNLSTRIVVWDHNWDNPEYPIDVLNTPGVDAAVSGVAFHCYRGLPSAQSLVHAAFPDKTIYESECTASGPQPDVGSELQWMGQNLLIGAVRNWASAILRWNLVLDENHGPYVQGCSNCNGLVTVHPGDGSATYDTDFYALGQVSKFVQSGARQVGSSVVGDDALETVAFVNPDNSHILLILNASPGPGSTTVSLRWKDYAGTFDVPAQGLATLIWGAVQSPPGTVRAELEGHFVHVLGHPIYLIQNAQKRLVPDWNTFLANGGTTGDDPSVNRKNWTLFTVADLSAIPDGPPLASLLNRSQLPSTGNLLPNPSFESAGPGSGGPAGWTGFAAFGEYVKGVAHSGTRSIAVVGGGWGPGPIRIEPQQRYRFGIWARQDLGQGEVGGELEVFAGLRTLLFVAPIPNEWTLFTADLTFPANTRTIQLEIHYTNWATTDPSSKVAYGKSKGYFDDVYLGSAD